VYHDRNSRDQEDDDVFVKVYRKGGSWSWKPGVIRKCTGPVSFQVSLENGSCCRKHQDQIRKRGKHQQLCPSTDLWDSWRKESEQMNRDDPALGINQGQRETEENEDELGVYTEEPTALEQAPLPRETNEEQAPPTRCYPA